MKASTVEYRPRISLPFTNMQLWRPSFRKSDRLLTLGTRGGKGLSSGADAPADLPRLRLCELSERIRMVFEAAPPPLVPKVSGALWERGVRPKLRFPERRDPCF